MHKPNSLLFATALIATMTLLIGGCANRPSSTAPTPSASKPVRSVELPSSAPLPSANTAQTSPVTGATTDSRNSKNTPIADRPINVVGQCHQTEEDGFREQANLRVEQNQVRELNWKLWVGKRGQCTFDGSEFTQSQSRPHIELLAKDGSGCKLMIWQTPQRVTLAHANCQRRCSAGIYDDAWPVMFHPQTGACARVG